MSHKIKSLSVVSSRIILGLIYFVFGLNFFFQFLGTPPPAGGAAESFTTGLFMSGYFFPVMKVIEVTLGFALIVGVYVPLALVVLMPITVNILLFHLFLTDNAIMSIVMVGLQLYLAWMYRDYYKPLFEQRALVH